MPNSHILIVLAGLGMSFDMDSLDAPGARGDYFSALHSKADTIAAALVDGGYDFGLLHVKAVDDTGHDRMVAMKVGGWLTEHEGLRARTG